MCRLCSKKVLLCRTNGHWILSVKSIECSEEDKLFQEHRLSSSLNVSWIFPTDMSVDQCHQPIGDYMGMAVWRSYLQLLISQLEKTTTIQKAVSSACFSCPKKHFAELKSETGRALCRHYSELCGLWGRPMHGFCNWCGPSIMMILNSDNYFCV